MYGHVVMEELKGLKRTEAFIEAELTKEEKAKGYTRVAAPIYSSVATIRTINRDNTTAEVLPIIK